MNWDYTNESKSASYPKFDSFKVRIGTLREIKRYFRTVSRNILEYIVLFPEKKYSKNAIRLILMPSTILCTCTCFSEIIGTSAF